MKHKNIIISILTGFIVAKLSIWTDGNRGIIAGAIVALLFWIVLTGYDELLRQRRVSRHRYWSEF